MMQTAGDRLPARLERLIKSKEMDVVPYGGVDWYEPLLDRVRREYALEVDCTFTQRTSEHPSYHPNPLTRVDVCGSNGLNTNHARQPQYEPQASPPGGFPSAFSRGSPIDLSIETLPRVNTQTVRGVPMGHFAANPGNCRTITTPVGILMMTRMAQLDVFFSSGIPWLCS